MLNDNIIVGRVSDSITRPTTIYLILFYYLIMDN